MSAQFKRRDFITLLGGAAAAWPRGGRARQRAKLPRIGFLGLVFERTAGEWLRAGLRDLGHIEGTNIIIEWQWAQNRHANAAIKRIAAAVGFISRVSPAERISRRRCEKDRPGLSDWGKLTGTCFVKHALDQKSDLAVLNFVCQL